ncbi:MAG: glucose dehydrogenase [Chloroflexi bacterium]|nr:MAG: glucose dehydrogenase [Chloroflexota bacterium]MBL1194530.1 glucose dehydrogenase [Chloroflexota bacterium]NOH11818.1 glucose dehydrogenase [Chloroflexota bacterium]
MPISPAWRRLSLPLVILFVSLSCNRSINTPTPLSPTEAPPIVPTNPPATQRVVEPAVEEPQTDDLASVTSIPDASAYAWNFVAGDYDKPIDLQHPGDGSGRIFIVEQVGRINIIQFGEKLNTPFLDITGRVNDGGFEQGLLGLAFHPNYADNGYFYVNYTDARGDTVIARFSASDADPNQADPDSELQLLNIEQPFANHNGGGLDFGPDGYLYIGLGDGGSGGDPLNNGQTPSTLLGSLLRLDVDSGERYGIPADNPFVNGGGAAEVWAYGLRNPWRFSFDSLTGELFIADVGQNAWEEIHYLATGEGAGANLGWKFFEGTSFYEGTPPEGLQLINPVAEYPHTESPQGNGCSVTGGYVYRGLAWPEWYGVYIYGDFCSGIVWGLMQDADGNWQNEIIFRTPYSISSFGEEESGELFLVDHSGAIFELGQP